MEQDNKRGVKERLEEFGKYMEALLQNDRIIVAILDGEGRIARLSRGCERFAGRKEAQLRGMDSRQVFGDSMLYECAVTGRYIDQQVEHLDGREMIVNCIPLKDAQGLFGALGIVTYSDWEKFEKVVKHIRKMRSELAMYKDQFHNVNAAKYSLDSIIGSSRAMKELKEIIRRSARSNSNVLITGESGTGKELFAHAVHMESNRRSGPFISINCAAIPAELLESELFGYVEGAFTGARKGGKIGVFQAADGGTLFLDEVGDLPLSMQAKLLRVVQEREVKKVGAYVKDPVDIRLVAATNRDLEGLRDKGDFRKDLYFRLDVIHLRIPPLRERREDIPPLTLHLIKKYSQLQNLEITGISAGAMDAFMRYDWPGNVREMEHVIERAANFLDGEKVIQVQNLPKRITGKSQHLNDMSLREYMEDMERKILLETIIENKGNKSAVAKKLRISRTSLYEKLEKYQIHMDEINSLPPNV